MKNTFVKTMAVLLLLVIAVFAVSAVSQLRNKYKNAYADEQYKRLLQAYIVYEMNDVTYTCYESGTGSIFIERKTVTPTGGGNQEVYEKAYDTWANRFSASYVPINDP